jgi:hypothetical protein
MAREEKPSLSPLYPTSALGAEFADIISCLRSLGATEEEVLLAVAARISPSLFQDLRTARMPR